ncbi:MAG: tRNA (N(6)-L-threonylcarbamoyladenosine(37)-C(2))-methylthiotransferase MtaB [Muribaculaceae bacterium]|nr:tRNA (N(6)-L-threonylcarbamoyladenosine(37)-C(2))-methylthiotransferase MtaB [Bacteroidales bacterium]MDD6851991.1 tRNA (N(6)-L-threonylcarbamoyladenosine(37)-C(2))-methylthiotransferase MtaB [Bacteroidales bacterium]MDD7405526.1 tRNA (N(6)-L-threonylcarbamoyladenosine(37)-C(2))-methylthiotransferase MtaB [Bacteroidales bacterium]MDY2931806.1 tRNA (N(6)-L-threonylcarbamoyladenosine(37)-C(2))-methylthiotransferase MtaB [Muribaculaceae bacterium]
MIDDTVFNGGTVEYHTLGCKLNFAETSTIGKILSDRGFHTTRAGEIPDIVVVNTCSVTELADKKGRQLIRRLVKKYPDALMVVTGCYAQLKGNEIAEIPGVDIVLGSEQKLEIARYIDEWRDKREQSVVITPHNMIRRFGASCSRGDRTRYFLKVQDGCDYYCSYCTIPIARGRSRSGSIESMVEQARQVAAEGGKEIIITGVNIGDFGKGTDHNFFDLVKALDEVDGIERYRISSIEPNLLTDEIIEWVAQSRRFMPHFHIPLQSGCDEVLKIMRRHYDTALYASKIEKIRSIIPDAFIGVDLIVGMRGETPEFFEQSLQFCRSIDVSRLHVFPYSERPGTRALGIDYVVSPQEKSLRAHKMLALSDEKLRNFTSRFIGTSRPVLFEQPPKGHPMHGFTDNYLRVETTYNPALVNNIAIASLDEIIGDEMNVKSNSLSQS